MKNNKEYENNLTTTEATGEVIDLDSIEGHSIMTVDEKLDLIIKMLGGNVDANSND